MTAEPSPLGVLLTTDPPFISLVAAPKLDVWNRFSETGRLAGIAVRFFHAGRMTSTEGLWAEFEAVLQWPTYFGSNWNAFHDFLRDLEWINAGGYVFVVFDAEQLLEDEAPYKEHDPPDPLAAFVADFTGYAEWFQEPFQLSWTETRPPTPFHVVLQVEPDRESQLLSRLSAAGVRVPTAPFVVPAPRPPHEYTPEELKLLGFLAEYVGEHDGLAPWGPEGTPASPEWNAWLAEPGRAPDPPGWAEWLSARR